jgi:hypothetical protein
MCVLKTTVLSLTTLPQPLQESYIIIDKSMIKGENFSFKYMRKIALSGDLTFKMFKLAGDFKIKFLSNNTEN